MGTGPKTLSILRFNAYGWFERVDTGVYGLAAHAAADLGAWPELRKRYMAAARRAARKAGRSSNQAPAARRAARKVSRSSTPAPAAHRAAAAPARMPG
jgi:hypothetical protein